MSKEVTPQFPFYAQDFLTGCVYMTNEEIGMYIKLLCKQWTDGNIPKKRVGLFLGIDWDNASEELKSKFIDDGETLINTRLEAEREKRKRFKEKQSENGKKGGRPLKTVEFDKAKNKPNKSQKKPLDNDNDKDNDKDIANYKDNRIIELKKIVEIFNSVCKNLPNVQKITKQRESSINARVQDYGLQKIGQVFQIVSTNEFMNGNNDRGWRADFDWIMNPNNFIKILEGKYNGKPKTTTGKSKVGYSEDFLRKIADKVQS